MKFAPRSFMIVLCFSSLSWGCRYEVNPHKTPEVDSNKEVPEEQLQDTSNFDQPVFIPAPDTNPAIRAKKKSGSQLDTLRPIQA